MTIVECSELLTDRGRDHLNHVINFFICHAWVNSHPEGMIHNKISTI